MQVPASSVLAEGQPEAALGDLLFEEKHPSADHLFGKTGPSSPVGGLLGLDLDRLALIVSMSVGSPSYHPLTT